MDNATQPFYKDGLKFECQRCSFCCGHSPGFVYLSKTDLENLCKFFKMEQKDFIEKYCRWVTYYGGKKVLSLLEKQNYDCILWQDGCTAYEARPIQCRTYPFWDWMICDQKTWNDCAKSCPGMNKGALHPQEEIEHNSHQYLANNPIRQENWEKN